MVEWIVGLFAWLLSDLTLIDNPESGSVQAYGSAAQAILGVVITPATIYAAVMAHRAWRAATHQRHDALMPLLAASIDPDTNYDQHFRLLLANVGVGPAIEVVAVTPMDSVAGVEWDVDEFEGRPPEAQVIPIGDPRSVAFIARRARDVLAAEIRAWTDFKAASASDLADAIAGRRLQLQQQAAQHSDENTQAARLAKARQDEDNERWREEQDAAESRKRHELTGRLDRARLEVERSISANPTRLAVTIHYQDVYRRRFRIVVHLVDDGPPTEKLPVRSLRIARTEYHFPDR